ncbi:helix-turn-helix domain-containing protein [Cellulomonas sp. NPDC055163]
MTTAATLLRAGRAARRVSQRQLAVAARTDRPAIIAIEKGTRDPSVGVLDRLLAAVGHRLISVPTLAAPVAVFADEIARHLLTDDPEGAFRTFLQLHDTLRSQDAGVQVALCLTEPAPTGSAPFDALIAGLVEHLLTARKLPVPAWVEAPSRFLGSDWFVDDSAYARAHDRDAAPAAFARRRVYLAPAELASA